VTDFGLGDWNSIPGRGRDFCHHIQTGSGANAPFCPVGTEGFFPVGKANRV